MKAHIIALSKEPIIGCHNLFLKFKGKHFFVKVEKNDADQLLANGKFKDVEGAWYEAAPSKNHSSKVTKNLKKMVYRYYGKEDLFDNIEEWTKFVTLSIDRDYLPCDQYDDLIFFLYQLKEALNTRNFFTLF